MEPGKIGQLATAQPGLDDCFAEQSSRSWTAHQQQDRFAACAVAEDGNLMRIAPEVCDIALYPAQRGKLIEQASNNSREQFASSPDLPKAILDAILDAFEAHTSMSKQALDSETVRDGLKDVLFGPGRLYEALRRRVPAQDKPRTSDKGKSRKFSTGNFSTQFLV